ncbi:hypothetical protein VTK56DRAFT_6029 [Thermocarpiscus australiensis]
MSNEYGVSAPQRSAYFRFRRSPAFKVPHYKRFTGFGITNLVNQTTSHNVHAFITRLAIQYSIARAFLNADGQGLYFPKALLEG